MHVSLNVIHEYSCNIVKNAVFWDVAPRISCMNRRFGGTYRLHLQGRKFCERGTSVKQVAAASPPWKPQTLHVNSHPQITYVFVLALNKKHNLITAYFVHFVNKIRIVSEGEKSDGGWDYRNQNLNKNSVYRSCTMPIIAFTEHSLHVAGLLLWHILFFLSLFLKMFWIGSSKCYIHRPVNNITTLVAWKNI
jgi:hypothetical protein